MARPLILPLAVFGFACIWWSTLGTNKAKEAALNAASKNAGRSEKIDGIGLSQRIPDAVFRDCKGAAQVDEKEVPVMIQAFPTKRLLTPYAAMMINRWVAMNPEAAAEWSAQISDPLCRLRILESVACSWADTDTPAALAWANQLSGDEKEAALVGISRIVANSDPAVALQMAKELGRNELVCGYLRDWAGLDPIASANWSKQMPDPLQRSAAQYEIVTEWALRDPSAAAGFAIHEMAGTKHHDAAILSVISQVGTTDLPMLRDWVTNFPEGSLKQSAKAELARIERLLPAAPASLAGEDNEDRTPLTVSKPQTK